MEFEYDPEKSLKNKEKHGIDFEEAQRLWEDPMILEIATRYEGDEERLYNLGMIGDKNYTAVITYRKGKIRIISVRRSNKNEVKLYDIGRRI